MKIVVVDDYPLEGKTIEFLLKRDRPEVQYCGQALNGEAGEKLILRCKPDIAIVDVKMPGVDGLTLLKKIKHLLPKLNVIILSAFGEFSFVQSAIRLGACDYLLKPLNPEELYQAIDKIVATKSHTAAYKEVKKEGPEELDIPKGFIQKIREGDVPESKKQFQQLWENYLKNGEHSFREIKLMSRCVLARIFEEVVNPEDMLEDESLREEGVYLYQHFATQLPAILDMQMLKDSLLKYVESMAGIHGYHFNETGDEQIKRAKAIIEKNLGNKISLNMVAQEVYISSFYLSSLFKKRTGMNFIDYVIDRRIEKAKQLLNTTNETIEAISAQVGYGESNYFRRLFKKKVGLTPREYRRQNLRRKGQNSDVLS